MTPKLALTGHRRPRCWRGGARTAMSGMCYVAPSWTAPRQGPRRQRRSSRSISYEHSRRAPGRGTVSTLFSLKRFDCARGSTAPAALARPAALPVAPRGSDTFDAHCPPRRGAKTPAARRTPTCPPEALGMRQRLRQCNASKSEMYVGHSSQPGAPPPIPALASHGAPLHRTRGARCAGGARHGAGCRRYPRPTHCNAFFLYGCLLRPAW